MKWPSLDSCVGLRGRREAEDECRSSRAFRLSCRLQIWRMDERIGDGLIAGRPADLKLQWETFASTLHSHHVVSSETLDR